MSLNETELYKIIGKTLRQARERKELSNVEVSKILKSRGISIADTSLRRYESGDRAIKIEMLVALCDIYDLDYMEVMKNAQIQRLKSLDRSVEVYEAGSSDPIAKTYGSDASLLLNIFMGLNEAGKEQALTQLRMIANTPEFVTKEKTNVG